MWKRRTHTSGKKPSKWPDTNYGLLINWNFRSHPYEEPGSCIRALLTTRPEKNYSEKHLSWKLFFDNSMRFSYLLNRFNEGKSKASWSGRENLPNAVLNSLRDRQWSRIISVLASCPDYPRAFPFWNDVPVLLINHSINKIGRPR